MKHVKNMLTWNLKWQNMPICTHIVHVDQLANSDRDTEKPGTHPLLAMYQTEKVHKVS